MFSTHVFFFFVSEVQQHQSEKFQYGMLSDAASGNVGMFYSD